MHRVIRLALAVAAGSIVGSLVNMALVHVGSSLVPPPAGTNTGTMEGLVAALPLFGPEHFLFPFLAHAIGTLVGALVATLLTPGRTPGPTLVVGVFFLLGGIASVVLLPAPVWFAAVDLLLAYLPAAWLGHRLASRVPPNNSSKPTPLRGAA